MKKRKRISYQTRRKRKLQRQIRVGFLCLCAVFCVLLVKGVYKKVTAGYMEIPDSEITAEKPDIQVDLLEKNPYSRPGIEIGKIQGIVIHYTANPGSTAKQNRDYFNGLKDTHITHASSHFVVGLEGEIVQCIPTWEISYASNDRNGDTISIETCHPDTSGKFTEKTYRSLVRLTGWLCQKFDLSSSDVIRHYDVTGKNCPKYFVEHEDAWQIFKGNVQKVVDKANSQK
ncbi:peptidoglycan recognition protein family protein [Lachnoclostridium sp. An181]|uniref:peptidoglycan recognition protein family protein n=1 Tax=Lachnoclostridium sp. An181 TaxID=1965575 RepID=UPI000B38474D|nr:peptidoglycan recognition family protein [Lachnoclostridium sp. An181]OUP50608.1 N-acetylmuramoyl-L-alanine amidase [Lachnoclostridium sp. An181]